MKLVYDSETKKFSVESENKFKSFIEKLTQISDGLDNSIKESLPTMSVEDKFKMLTTLFGFIKVIDDMAYNVFKSSK
jgi:hypothetical protein